MRGAVPSWLTPPLHHLTGFRIPIRPSLPSPNLRQPNRTNLRGPKSKSKSNSMETPPISKKPNDNKNEKDESRSPSPPPVAPEPPEKPLPGDCCGSGCVRCVWDLYYDELEEYNKKLASLHPPDRNKD